MKIIKIIIAALYMSLGLNFVFSSEVPGEKLNRYKSRFKSKKSYYRRLFSDKSDKKDPYRGPFFLPKHEFSDLILTPNLIDFNLTFDQNIEVLIKKVNDFEIKYDDLGARRRVLCSEDGFLSNEIKLIVVMYFRLSHYMGEKYDYYGKDGLPLNKDKPIRVNDWRFAQFKLRIDSLIDHALEWAQDSTVNLEDEILQNKIELNQSIYEFEFYEYLHQTYIREVVKQRSSIESHKQSGQSYWTGFDDRLSFYRYIFTSSESNLRLITLEKRKHVNVGHAFDWKGSHQLLIDLKDSFEKIDFSSLVELENKLMEEGMFLTNETEFKNMCLSYADCELDEVIKYFNLDNIKKIKGVEIQDRYISKDLKGVVLENKECVLHYRIRKLFNNKEKKSLCTFETRRFSFQGVEEDISLTSCM